MIQDPYKVLGIGKDASKEEVKKAYRSMAKNTIRTFIPMIRVQQKG